MEDSSYNWDFCASEKMRRASRIKQGKVKDMLEGNPILKNKSLNILSVGAGSGSTDQFIVKENALNVSLYYVVDPAITDYHSMLDDRVKSWNIPYVIEKKSFSEKYSVPENAEVNYPDGSTKPLSEMLPDDKDSGMFDLIIMSGVLYYMDHPGMVIEKARSLLKRGGRIIIFIQTIEVGAEIYTHMVKTSPPEFQEKTSNYAMSSLDIVDELKTLNIPYTCDVSDDAILCHDVTDYLTKRIPSKVFLEFLEFESQLGFEEWSEEQKTGVYEIVKKRSFVTSEGRYLAPDYFSTFIVGSKA